MLKEISTTQALVIKILQGEDLEIHRSNYIIKENHHSTLPTYDNPVHGIVPDLNLTSDF